MTVAKYAIYCYTCNASSVIRFLCRPDAGVEFALDEHDIPDCISSFKFFCLVSKRIIRESIVSSFSHIVLSCLSMLD